MKAALSIVALLVFVMAGTAPALAQQGIHRIQGAPRDTLKQERGGTLSLPGLPSGTTPAARPLDPDGPMRKTMQETMRDPLRRSTVLLYGLPTLTQPLELSESQVKRLHDALAAYQERSTPLRQRAAWATQQLDDELAKPSSDATRVRALLRERAFQRSDVTALDFEAASEMLDTLTPAQRQALANLDPAVLHHHLKTHLTEEEMGWAMGGRDDEAKSVVPKAPK